MAAVSLYPFEWLGKSRASLPKVKTGCISCKKRHVKCDEGKPICKRCQKGNRSCVYQSQQTTVPKEASLQIRLHYPSPRPPPIKKTFSFEAERCGFESFQQIPAEVLGGGLGWRDWGNIVLQNSDNDPALRHAVIALGIMHEEALRNLSAVSTTVNRQLLPMAYKQYQEAIKRLRSQLQNESTRSVEANILACMVLIVFDFMQGDYRAAGVHLAGGVAMLRRYLRHRSSSEALIARISTPWRTSLERSGISPTEGSLGARLLLSYGYLDFWASCWMDGLPALPEVSVLEGLAVRRPPRPDTELNTSFQTFAPLENRIREFLRSARGLMYPHGQQVPPTDSRRLLPYQSSSFTFSQMKMTLKSLLADWHENYQRVCTTYICHEPRELQAIDCVAVNHKKIETMLEAAQGDGTVEYQASAPAFREVLRLSRKVFEADGFPLTSPYYAKSPFSFTIGIIHPLYITAMNCDDLSVCQEAIDMLSSRHWKEGAWDSFMMANIAREQLSARRYISAPH